ncbi:hypothetical protein PROFUN_14671 [Planoprotostelium fungivorum]|uniref:Uncharacterized protein n=1 Tax=Planoprotostelium fungivorum TaxID=1890364 RepID=A0A2P6MZ39_9EUKA|nr:hypothetical protein PROFUN_14671 [Planoprotostelium fungivorum]
MDSCLKTRRCRVSGELQLHKRNQPPSKKRKTEHIQKSSPSSKNDIAIPSKKANRSAEKEDQSKKWTIAERETVLRLLIPLCGDTLTPVAFVCFQIAKDTQRSISDVHQFLISKGLEPLRVKNLSCSEVCRRLSLNEDNMEDCIDVSDSLFDETLWPIFLHFRDMIYPSDLMNKTHFIPTSIKVENLKMEEEEEEETFSPSEEETSSKSQDLQGGKKIALAVLKLLHWVSQLMTRCISLSSHNAKSITEEDIMSALYMFSRETEEEKKEDSFLCEEGFERMLSYFSESKRVTEKGKRKMRSTAEDRMLVICQQMSVDNEAPFKLTRKHVEFALHVRNLIDK